MELPKRNNERPFTISNGVGASLCALNKKEGGIRPIAVGNTFRRLTSKLACSSVRSDMSLKFQPKQVGFGTRGGGEAAAHATRTFIKKNKGTNQIVLKIDFKNAFNEIDREKFLNEVRINAPQIFHFISQCYYSPTYLFFGEEIILSQAGAQQGDPCGPLLFCLAINYVVELLKSQFVVFYLDDGTIAGNPESVFEDFKFIIAECSKIGLKINADKCELFFISNKEQEVETKFNMISPGIKIISELTLLGAPITENSIRTVFEKKKNQLKILFQRLIELDNYHIGFYILRNCFALPKLIYLLRTTPLWNYIDILQEMDDCIRDTLETLTNCKLNTTQWIMSSLPIHCGGLGVRKITDVALPAFLSSVNSVLPLVKSILKMRQETDLELPEYENGLNVWQNMNLDIPEIKTFQKNWDSINLQKIINNIQFNLDEEKALFLANQRSESGAWLHALPSKEIGTLLNNNEFRISIGLRLGCDICVPHKCICGDFVNEKGRHGLSCYECASRFAGHCDLNLIIKKTLMSADHNSILEPPGLCREDGKRVDGMTLTAWSKGQILIWDATCTDTFASSNVKRCAKKAGSAAEKAATRKKWLYRSLINQNYYFLPFAVETMGPWCEEANRFINEIGKQIIIKTNEPRSIFFLKQNISISIQKRNAAAVMGSLRKPDKQ